MKSLEFRHDTQLCLTRGAIVELARDRFAEDAGVESRGCFGIG